MFGLTSKQRNVTKMVCYSKLPFSFMSAEIKPKLILVTKCYSLDRHAFLGLFLLKKRKRIRKYLESKSFKLKYLFIYRKKSEMRI